VGDQVSHPYITGKTLVLLSNGYYLYQK
jgi:hypothetical protein